VQEVPPLPLFVQAAAGVGQIHGELDQDGVLRSIYLKEGSSAANKLHFAPTLLSVARGSQLALPGARLQSDPAAGWQRDYQFQIPYVGAPGTFRQISVISLLRGDVPKHFLRGKIVLVGATATGMGDLYPTPVSGKSQAMAGVEIHANIIDALLNHIDVRLSASGMQLAYAVLPWFLAMISFLYFGPRQALTMTAGLGLGVILMSVLSLRFGQIWLPPSAALMGLALCYPLWSWRRLEASMGFMRGEVFALNREASRLPGVLPEVSAESNMTMVDPVAAQIIEVHEATERMESWRHFVEDVLRNQSDGLLMVDGQGRILLANPNAAAFLGYGATAALRSKPLDETLARFPCAQAGGWASMIQQAQGDYVVQAETHTKQGQDLLVSIIATRSELNRPVGWVINLTDISRLKDSERQRQQMLDFLSHDMRAPQASILALLQSENERPSESHGALHEKIAANAQRTLHLANQFMQLSRAENLRAEQLEELDLVTLMHDAIDEVWPQAEAARIKIQRDFLLSDATVSGEPRLLFRALVNLLSNAIKHSPAESTIRCVLRRQGEDFRCEIIDHGEGIRAEDLPRIFQRFIRLENAKHHDGAGLGLALVDMVVRKHRGRIEVASKLGKGSRFSLCLPMQLTQ
jgi:PAS domain S-box-containing protein